MATEIPVDVKAAIFAHAQAEWPDDPQMRRFFIAEEVAGWTTIAELEFGSAEDARDAILREAAAYDDQWSNRAEFVKDEVKAFAALAELQPDDVAPEVLMNWKAAAASEYDWFQQRLEEVEGRIAHHRYVQQTRARVEPIRGLLAEMERIVGSECYNGYIQNYSSWGVWEGDGRAFRYPVSFVRGEKVEKRPGRTADLAAEELVSGFYRFGANELGIYRALVKIVDMLERDYGLDVGQRGGGAM